MESELPTGGISRRKYAAVLFALVTLRSQLDASYHEEPNDLRAAFDATRLDVLATKFGYEEEEIAIDWHDHLTSEERHAFLLVD